MRLICHVPSPLVTAILSAILAGCGTITYIEASQSIPEGSPTPNDGDFLLNLPVNIIVRGQGICDIVDVSFGDGESARVTGMRFDSVVPNPPVKHTYRGWPGPKTITVTGSSGLGSCSGSLTLKRNLVDRTLSQSVRVAFAVGKDQGGGTQACFPLPGLPPLRGGTTVLSKEVRDAAGAPMIKIDFGCLLSGCVYGASGKGSFAGPEFPLPEGGEYSLFFRVATRTFNVAENGIFTLSPAIELPAPLEMCINDSTPADDKGGWLIDVLAIEPP